MRLTTLAAIALVFTASQVEAVELHAHQKSAAGAHIRRRPSPARALAQQKSKAHGKSDAKKLNFGKLKDKLNKAKSWAMKEADKVKEDAANIKGAIDSGDYAGALEAAKADIGDLGEDGRAAVDDVKQSAEDVQE